MTDNKTKFNRKSIAFPFAIEFEENFRWKQNDQKLDFNETSDRFAHPSMLSSLFNDYPSKTDGWNGQGEAKMYALGMTNREKQ